MILEKFVEKFRLQIQHEINASVTPRLCAVHETVAPYHQAIGMLSSLKFANELAEKVMNDMLSGKNEPVLSPAEGVDCNV